jgi:hypothetical protein
VPEIVLHIGAFKTGTSFIQDTLSANKPALAADGILFPGKVWPDQIQAVRALAARSDPGAPETVRGHDAWDDLVTECHAWYGHLAVVSMEFLSPARLPVAAAAVRSFSPEGVRIVLGARNLTDVIPAQWQESLQSSGRTWTLRDYTAAVMRPREEFTEASRHFWRKHNWPQILARWKRAAPASPMLLLTVPRRGAAPDVLWHRFGAAAGFDAAGYPLARRANESLGAPSLEIARRVNVEAQARGMTTARNPTFRRILCKRVMAARRSLEPGIALPTDCDDWLAETTEVLLEKVNRLDPLVVGDLSELVPARTGPPAGTTSRPELSSVDDLLEAAESAAAGLSRALGVSWSVPTTGRPEDRLVAMVRALTDMATSTA